MQDIQQLIRQAKEKKWEIVLYGLGQLGRDVGALLLSYVSLNINYVCDKNYSTVIDFTNKENYVGITLEKLLKAQRDMLVFVCIGTDYVDGVKKSLEINPYLHVVTIDDFNNTDIILEKFYSVKNISSLGKSFSKCADITEKSKYHKKEKRIAIYTCITGGYDQFIEPKVIETDCDYYYIGDKKPNNLSIFKFIDVDSIAPDNFDNATKNRWCKMHGYEIFSEYKYSIYIDGSICLLKPIAYYVTYAERSGLALHKHFMRDCIYEEGFRVIVSKKSYVDYEGIRRQMVGYMNEGMPRHYGLFECGVIVRNHDFELINVIMDQWFEEYIRGQKRDQLSLTYVLWKNKIKAEQIGLLNEGNDLRKNKDFVLNDKHIH